MGNLQTLEVRGQSWNLLFRVSNCQVLDLNGGSSLSHCELRKLRICKTASAGRHCGGCLVPKLPLLNLWLLWTSREASLWGSTGSHSFYCPYRRQSSPRGTVCILMALSSLLAGVWFHSVFSICSGIHYIQVFSMLKCLVFYYKNAYMWQNIKTI